MKNILCQACLKDSKDVSPMAPADINWYNRLVKEVQNNEEMVMCVFCSTLFRKMIVFIEQCQRAQILLKQVYSQEIQLLPPSIGRSITISPTTTLYVGPDQLQEIDLDLKADDSNFDYNEAYVTEDEDDVPLVLFSGKEDREDAKNVEEFPDDKIKKESLEALELKPRSTTKRQKVIREGFSSRMVQETPEYLVIKLSKEQASADDSSDGGKSQSSNSPHLTNESHLRERYTDIDKKKRVLIPWTEEQKSVVRKFFKRHIRNCQPPKQHECERLIDRHSDLLHNKDWLKIKVYVQNVYMKKTK